MRKWLPCKAMVIAMLLTGNNAGAQQLKLKRYKAFPGYSSASALAWHRRALYVVGDDAPTLLVLDKKLREKRQLRLFDYTGKRMPYPQKADFEAATVITEGNNHTLWLFPSFSTPVRNKVIRLDAGRSGANPALLTLNRFVTGLPITNIEGAEWINGKLLLANRANRNAPTHHLLQYDLSKQVLPEKPDATFTLELPQMPQVVGISGMYYLKEKDLLLLTVSTELTASPTADGMIGSSYLAFVQDAGKQIAAGNSVKAQNMVLLNDVLQQKQPMKIESVTVIKNNKRKATLALAADNDDGSSHLFLVSLKHQR